MSRGAAPFISHDTCATISTLRCRIAPAVNVLSGLGVQRDVHAALRQYGAAHHLGHWKGAYALALMYMQHEREWLLLQSCVGRGSRAGAGAGLLW
jgi:hypothetical protein